MREQSWLAGRTGARRATVLVSCFCHMCLCANHLAFNFKIETLLSHMHTAKLMLNMTVVDTY